MMKYLPKYYEWMETGKLPGYGLCNCFGISHDEHYWEPKPGFDDFQIMFPDKRTVDYWGVEPELYGRDDSHLLFTPLRQTMVLFMAAMNNEL